MGLGSGRSSWDAKRPLTAIQTNAGKEWGDNFYRPFFVAYIALGSGLHFLRGTMREFEMVDDAAAARRYRKRATEVRAIAEAMTERNSRVILLRIAADYERMARLRVRVGKANRIMAGTTSEVQRSD